MASYCTCQNDFIGKTSVRFETLEKHPYLAFMGKLWVTCVLFGEKLPQDVRIKLYYEVRLDKQHDICVANCLQSLLTSLLELLMWFWNYHISFLPHFLWSRLLEHSIGISEFIFWLFWLKHNFQDILSKTIHIYCIFISCIRLVSVLKHICCFYGLFSSWHHANTLVTTSDWKINKNKLLE